MNNSRLLSIIFSLLVIFTLLDIVSDIRMGVNIMHLAEELATALLSLGVIFILFKRGRKQKTELLHLRTDLEASKKIISNQSFSMQQSRADYSHIIAEQFQAWNLTKSEKQTAYALLKGLSFKEIALTRDIREKSVRQQASGIYTKANIEGRHSLSAWFFEDFLHE